MRKNKPPRRITVSAAAALAASLLLSLTVQSCRHKELCYDHTHTATVTVQFDWSADPGASPSSMSLYLFPDGGGEPVRHDFSDINGGVIEMSSGTWHAVCLNNDTETLLLDGMESFDSFSIRTREASVLEGMGMTVGGASTMSADIPKATGTGDQRSVLAPDMLWSDFVKDIVLLEDQTHTLTMCPEKSAVGIHVSIINVENIEGLSAVSGSLSGVNSTFDLSHGLPAGEPSIVPFAAVDDGVSTISGDFHVFGHSGAGDGTPGHMLTLYMILTDGRQFYAEFDVTGQMHASEDEHEIYILIDGLVIEKSTAGSSGGFSPSIDDWLHGEDISITM